MISVSAVAIAFLTIGYFFKIKEIKSPELTEVSHTHEADADAKSHVMTWFVPEG